MLGPCGEVHGLYALETLAFKKEAVGIRGKRHSRKRPALGTNRADERRLKTVIVHSCDRGDVGPGAVADGGIAGIGSICGAVQTESVDLDMECLGNIAYRALYLDVHIILGHGHNRKFVRRQEILDSVDFLSGRAITFVELVLRDPLPVLAGPVLVRLLHQLIELLLVVQFEPNGHRNDRRRIDRPMVNGLTNKPGVFFERTKLFCATLWRLQNMRAAALTTKRKHLWIILTIARLLIHIRTIYTRPCPAAVQEARGTRSPTASSGI